MNMNQKINAAVVITGVVIAGFDIISTIHHERSKRKEIRRQADAQIDAIHRAGDEFKTMLDEGLYDKQSLGTMLQDFNDLIKLEADR